MIHSRGPGAEAHGEVTVKHISLLSAALLCLLFMPVSAPAKSATFGVYAVIDQVTFEPEGSAPATVQISGIFVIPLPNSSGAYQAPQRGYLSFQLRPGQEAQDQKDWTALKAYAGTGRVVGLRRLLGVRPEQSVRLHAPSSRDPCTPRR